MGKQKEMPVLRCPALSVLMLCLTLQISSCLDDYDNERMEIEIDPQEQKEYLNMLQKLQDHIIEEKRSPFSQRQQFMTQKRSPFMQRNSFMQPKRSPFMQRQAFMGYKRSPFMQRNSFMTNSKRSPFAQRLNFMG